MPSKCTLKDYDAFTREFASSGVKVLLTHWIHLILLVLLAVGAVGLLWRLAWSTPSGSDVDPLIKFIYPGQPDARSEA